MRTNLETAEQPVVLLVSAFVTWRVYEIRGFLLWHHMHHMRGFVAHVDALLWDIVDVAHWTVSDGQPPRSRVYVFTHHFFVDSKYIAW